ncbi:MAG: alpha-hydroxy acid oxidase [Pseudomonadota bacterium]
MRDPFAIVAKAKRRLPRMMFDFIAGGTGAETAEAANTDALATIRLRPRALVNVEAVNLQTSLLGETYERPYGIAPMGMCNIVWPGTDQALSAEARNRVFPHCVSTAASTTIEDTAHQSGGQGWFQLYAGSDDRLTFELVTRAQAAGYRHLVITVDTPRHSRRTRDLENGFRVPMRYGPRQLLDFSLHPRWSWSTLFAGIPSTRNYDTSQIAQAFERYENRGRSDWAFLERLRKAWPHHLIIKGVSDASDARRMMEAGCDAIYVSNHGGRQLDSAVPAIHALEAVRSALGPDVPLIFDSGVRTADDIARAYVCGADFVMIGRPVLYAMGAGGAARLHRFLDHLDEDLRTVLAMLGALSPADLTADMRATAPGS